MNENKLEMGLCKLANACKMNEKKLLFSYEIFLL